MVKVGIVMLIAVGMNQMLFAAGARFGMWPAVAMGGVGAAGFALWRGFHAATCAVKLDNIVSDAPSTLSMTPRL